jgi:hypothetical protein
MRLDTQPDLKALLDQRAPNAKTGQILPILSSVVYGADICSKYQDYSNAKAFHSKCKAKAMAIAKRWASTVAERMGLPGSRERVIGCSMVDHFRSIAMPSKIFALPKKDLDASCVRPLQQTLNTPGIMREDGSAVGPNSTNAPAVASDVQLELDVGCDRRLPWLPSSVLVSDVLRPAEEPIHVPLESCPMSGFAPS